jgi:hypothetical protein
VLTLHGNVLGVEFSPGDKFRERFGNRRLGSNWVSRNHLYPAEFGSQRRSSITVNYLPATFFT